VTRFSYESQPGDVLVTPPGTEHENRYYGGSSVIIASILADDIGASFASEGALSDPAAWQRNHFRGNADTMQNVIPRLQSLVARLGDTALNAESAEFWKRAVIEAMSASIVEGTSSERDGPLPSALKIVRQVEDYLDAAEPAPIHISQICSHMHLSRRTLHRASSVRSHSFATGDSAPCIPPCARPAMSARFRTSPCCTASRTSAGFPATIISCSGSTRPRPGGGMPA
jgi:AraC family ethanolamine operon transcriptional activator